METPYELGYNFTGTQIEADAECRRLNFYEGTDAYHAFWNGFWAKDDALADTNQRDG